MKKIGAVAYFVFGLLLFAMTSCKKDAESTNSQGTFTVTKTGGSTWSTSYVNTPIPNSNGKFSLQYQKNGTGEKYMFFVLIDNNNDCGLDIITTTPVTVGTVYRGTQASFYGMFSNVNVNVSKTEVIFSSATYPGRVAGTYKVYNASNSIIYSGTFDLTVK